jgi:hypothetical protein
MNKKPVSIPNGIEHLSLLMTGAKCAYLETAKHFDEVELQRKIVGTCLNVLYQAATCHRKCHGGGHVLESLCGRAYNLSCAAYYLATIGFYDETLNLIRGIGEMTNLVILSASDPPKIREWLETNPKERLQKFSPIKVRLMLEALGVNACATEEWYKELSEDYAHITPTTKPNSHGGIPFVGALYKSEGMKKCFDALLYVMTFLSLFICRYFKFDDLFEELSLMLRESEPNDSNVEPTKN